VIRTIVCLFSLLGAVAVAIAPGGPASAAERRGSRILAYYRQASLSSLQAPLGSALTVVQVTNSSPSATIRVRVVLTDSASCEVSNLFTETIAPGGVARLNVASLVPGSREGVLDAWAIDDEGRPIQFNFLTADSTIADLQLPATIQMAAEPLVVVAGAYTAPTLLTANFFQVLGIQQRVVLTRPGAVSVSGLTPVIAQDTLEFHTPDAGVVNKSVDRVATCIISENLETIYGSGFAAGLPEGGTIQAKSSVGPAVPVVGWLLHLFPLAGSTPSALVMGIKLHPEQDGPLP
jgi:hypothetical protein